MGTSTIEIRSAPESSYWRAETLVLASDLGDGPLTLHRIGLRFKDLGDGPREMRGTVTLSRTRSDRLSERYADNLGEAPVSFFVEGKPDRADSLVLGYLVFFELDAGLRFDPAIDGNLRVGFEIQSSRDIHLDAAPTENTRLLLSPDFLAPSGTLTRQVPIMIFAVDRDRPIAAVTPTVERLAATAPAADPRIAAKVGALEAQVATLERSLGQLVAENRKLAAAVESSNRGLAALIAEQGVEFALASGSPLFVRPRAIAGRLETAHAVVRNAILAARDENLDVSEAEALLKQAKLENDRGDAGQAFATYARSFQSLIAKSPFTEPKAVDAGRASPRLSTRLRATPYDVR